MKTENNYMGFHIPKVWQILKGFAGTFIKHKPLISEECRNDTNITIWLQLLKVNFSSILLFFQRGLNPVIPAELVLSFYLQGWKLILAVYHIVVDPKTNQSKFNRYQAECVIPWVNDVLLLLTIALQSAQQLKDKVCTLLRAQSFTTLMADLHQDMKRVSSFSRCI